MEEATRRLNDLATQARVLNREVALGADHAARLEEIETERRHTEERLAALRARWEKAISHTIASISRANRFIRVILKTI